jgi:hypothetical protein
MSPTPSLSDIFTALGHPGCCSSPPPLFFLWRVSDVHKYIDIFTYVNVQGKTVPLNFCVPPPIPGRYEMGFPCLDRARNASLVRGAF